jgi:hypothetical protein
LLAEDVELLCSAHGVVNRVVFDVDADTDSNVPSDLQHAATNTNGSDNGNGNSNSNVGTLQFDSAFESGNLRRAIQVYPNVYDLVTSSVTPIPSTFLSP